MMARVQISAGIV